MGDEISFCFLRHFEHLMRATHSASSKGLTVVALPRCQAWVAARQAAGDLKEMRRVTSCRETSRAKLSHSSVLKLNIISGKIAPPMKTNVGNYQNFGRLFLKLIFSAKIQIFHYSLGSKIQSFYVAWESHLV